ncbi:family 78 glycoside hydrolase catalytic domain [Agrobacterium sp. S2/73]|nr:family 78 glycoside hydrolase catalytic domain [Agrobacterium sp. S2/73]QXZ76554.1 family 78 glycoside hydrolase catalytic domain [Agrobacterium sp. S7/73]QYA17337.1 family 78 glycoside hydrolase catalytic domain [Rhizobium sp. AB2/73]UEQ85670.1 family 78 glycoside hydrolase catalytic domain [Rhizobium sp. AB2/73]
MVAPLCDSGRDGPGSFVSKQFDLAKVPSSAVLHISALGLYRAFINGHRVGDDLLTPGWTCYDDRIAFQSYDVAQYLLQGQNHIEIWLGNGWYRSQLMWATDPIVDCWGSRIAAIAELVTDGLPTLKTDQSWKSGLTPAVKNGIYYGEDYDNRIALQSDHGVEPLAFDKNLLVPHETGAVKELSPIAPVDRWTEADGRHVFDFGQNAGAYIRFKVKGEAGATIRVEHSEIVGNDRHFDNRNYRSARAELVYTLSGNGEETYAPLFTFMGFRYARVTITGNAELLDIEMVPISSVPVVAGGFTSGVEAVNRLVENTIWSQRSNFIEIPTDCPQRDERLGWTGDAQVFAGTACWLADSHSFLKKYLRDVMHDQRENGAVPHFSPDPTRMHPTKDRGDWAGSTGWGDAIVIIPWQLYLHYGDKSALEECFPAMLKWLDYLWGISDGPLISPPAAWGAYGFTFGDWLQPVGDNRKPRPTIADDCAATIYHFISTDLTARIAAVLGRSQEADRLAAKAQQIKAAFKHEFFSPSGRIAHNDQTSWALAYLYGLVPEEYEEAGQAYFRRVAEETDGVIGTGFIGTPALLPALTRLGMLDLAEKMFLNRKVPGWLYQVERGATSIWERWDAIAEDGTIYDPLMNSYNHYAYGAVCQWLFEDVAGIKPVQDKPGFEEIDFDPSILPALSPVSAWHDTHFGRIEAGWSIEGDHVSCTLVVPKGVTAQLSAKAGRRNLQVGGASIAESQQVRLEAGTHNVTFQI